MEQLEVIKGIVAIASQAITGLVFVATILVRLSPTTKDDEAVKSIGGKLLTALHWLPTFGVNPQTKALQEALVQAQEELAKLKK